MLDVNTHLIRQNTRNLQLLYVEDDDEVRSSIGEILSEFFNEVDMAVDGQQGLELYQSKKYDIVISDIKMPNMNGIELTKSIKKINPEQIVLITSAHDDSQYLTQLINYNINRFIAKPIALEQFLSILGELSGNIVREREAETQRKNAGDKLRSQMEWLIYKDAHRSTEYRFHEMDAIHNLKRSLSEAGGFGVMVTLAEMLLASAVEDGDYYRVDKQIADLVGENSAVCRNLLNGMDVIETIASNDFSLKLMPASRVLDGLQERLDELKEYLKTRRLEITLPEIKNENMVLLDSEMLLLAVYELIVNACKYTHDVSRINVFVQSSQGYICIAVRNDLLGPEDKGIPPEYEKMVVESFFRLHPTMQGVGLKEDFPLGLGLAMVNYIAIKHSGQFMIGNNIDHTGREPKPCVLAQLYLPIVG